MLSSKRKKLGELLIEVNMITPQDLEKALEIQKQNGKKLGEILIDQKLVTESDVIQVLEFQLGIPHIDLDKCKIESSVALLINDAIAKRYCLIPVKKDGTTLTVAMSDPLNIFAIDDIKITTGLEVKPMIATKSEILRAIDKNYTSNSASRAAEEANKEIDDFLVDKDTDVDDRIALEVSNSPTVKLVNSILEQAIGSRASDIHVEPFESILRIRYRIDGELTETMRTDIKALGALVTRIKIMGGMNIAEKRLPQDGRIQYSFDEKEYDLRVSILPTVFGEKVVIRIAETRASVTSKSDLGFQEDDLVKFDGLLKHPHGIILVTGPTGSGKSTTLYTALRELNTSDVNIITVEDPVENLIEGINQVNVNTKAGLTFGNALRAILRQDPDIVMIGEIRDGETAEIAVKAAITGHLVLSTLHTNDAPSSINRLANMGIEPYLIADAVVGIIAQRLVRRICTHCKQEYEATQEELDFLGIKEKGYKLYNGKGCYHCNGTGFRGRVGLYEILTVNREIREAISKMIPIEELRDLCGKVGMKNLKACGFELVRKGLTTVKEVLGVAFDSDDIKM